MGAPAARIQQTGDRIDVRWPDLAECTELSAWCRQRDGTVHHSSGWSAASDGREAVRTRCGPLVVEVALAAADDCVRIGIEAEALTEVEVAEVALAMRPRMVSSSLRWLLYNGYQSWDSAGVLPIDGARWESWWTIAVADAAGAGIAAAAVAATSCSTRFAVSDGVLSVVCCEAESLETRPLLFGGPPGTRWRGEDVRMAAGADVRDRLGDLLSRPALPARAPVVGWLSWYHFGPWIGREELIAHADLLATDGFRHIGYRVIQLDDGWQQTYGEWLPNTKFPGGLEALSSEIRRRGQVPGLWTAPFLVSAAADLASEAPEEWFVVDPATGERAIDPRHRVFGPLYVLDATVPAVRDHLRELFAGFYRAGIRYFKIDFLYAGAYAGTRALRAGVEAIREGARDAPLVASGAPLLPLVGLAECCRIGPDTATPFIDFETATSAPTIFGDEVLAVARNAAARSMLHRWFRLDADVALVGGNLDLEQGRQLVTLAVLSGGPFFATDDLRALPPERLALLTNPEVMGLVGGAPAEPDWEPGPGDRPPTHWRRGDVLAVFNWDADATEVRVRAPGVRGARDLWAREDLLEFGDGAAVIVPGHGVRLLRLT